MAEPILELSGVHSFYGHIEALKGVSITVNKGEIVTIIGANGAGKSTLLMTICGSPAARSGKVVFKGKDITKDKTNHIVHSGIAQSPEGRRIFPRMSVMENLVMGAIVPGDQYLEEDMAKIFTMFPRLEERKDQRAGTLSGGEQQMLAIGRALMSRPTLLLLDEPSLGLAPLIVKQIFRVIKEINEQQGMTVLLVEQNAYHALKLAHRAYVMASGSIIMSGAGHELLANEEVRKAYLEGGH